MSMLKTHVFIIQTAELGLALYRKLKAPERQTNKSHNYGPRSSPSLLHLAAAQLLQLCVLRLGGDEDGNVRVGVFPERQLIGEHLLLRQADFAH
jgi:hypothetical protein